MVEILAIDSEKLDFESRFRLCFAFGFDFLDEERAPCPAHAAVDVLRQPRGYTLA